MKSKRKPFTILRQIPVMLSGWNLSFDLYFLSSVLKAFYCFQKDKIFPLKSDIILPSNNKNCLSSNISTNLWGILSPATKRNINCDHLDIDIRLSKDWLDLKLITSYKNDLILKKYLYEKKCILKITFLTKSDAKFEIFKLNWIDLRPCET